MEMGPRLDVFSHRTDSVLQLLALVDNKEIVFSEGGGRSGVKQSFITLAYYLVIPNTNTAPYYWYFWLVC